MPGLLADVLPYLYSRGDAMKRRVGSFLSDPIADLQQTAGFLVDQGNENRGLLNQAIGPKMEYNPEAAGKFADRAITGLLGFAPAGMTAKAGTSLPMDEASRTQRMQDQGFSPGWWRGGKSVADGPHYTPDKSAAEDFARRHGPSADVREYAISTQNQFRLSDSFSPQDLTRIRDVLRKDFGAKNADELLTIPTDFRSGRAPAGHIWQAIDYMSGGNGKDVLKAAGYDSINAGQELIVLNKAGTVRDKSLAVFDPKKRSSADPFAAFVAGAIGLGLLGNSLDRE